jgi:uncharacterized linocin/CFP29 family protein
MDLMNAGLTMNLNNALGTTRVEWEQATHMEGAEISMDGITRAQNDAPEFNLKALPIPIVHKGFHINIRKLEASRKLGEPLDTLQAEQSSTLVSERQEKILFKGSSLQANGLTIEGYTNATNRNTGSLSGDWSDPGAVDGTEIIQDLIAMIEDLKNDNQRGQVWVYVPTSYHNRMQDDYKANSDKTIMQRAMEIESITAIRESQELNDGASGEVVMVRPVRQTVDLIVGFTNTMVMWDTHGGMQTNFEVMSILVPRIRSDASGQSGIVHFSV